MFDNEDNDDLKDLFSKISEEMAKFIQHSIQNGELPMDGNFAGIRIDIGPNGSPKFTPINQSDSQIIGNKWQKPLIDVFVDEDKIIIVGDLQGIETDHVKITINDNKVMLQAVNQEYRYRKGIMLKHPIVQDTLQYIVRNGVLEIILQRKKH